MSIMGRRFGPRMCVMMRVSAHGLTASRFAIEHNLADLLAAGAARRQGLELVGCGDTGEALRLE